MTLMRRDWPILGENYNGGDGWYINRWKGEDDIGNWCEVDGCAEKQNFLPCLRFVEYLQFIYFCYPHNAHIIILKLPH